MGVPKFYRWLSERMPMVSVSLSYGREVNPRFDNLYLDMNGIIHRCTHPSDKRDMNAMNYDQMVIAIFQYLDIIFNLIKPTRLLMLAVDGVAPRAKMNQQRSRRFRAAMDDHKSKQDALAKGEVVSEDRFDSNCITPGTAFMQRLDKDLEFFVAKKIKEDAAWRSITIIYSGHSDPGEGEHKIMEYIRENKFRGGENWPSNLRHCLYGLDADLIMLGLVTHEPNFSLLREDVTILDKRNRNKNKAPQNDDVSNTPWQLLHICLIREYLDLEFRAIADKLTFEYDLEKIIDDFVFLCFFIGNDFLPSLPFLTIANGSLNEMIELYKLALINGDGYFTSSGKVHWGRCMYYLNILRDMELTKLEELNTHNKMIERQEKRKAKHAKQQNGETLSPPSSPSSSSSPSPSSASSSSPSTVEMKMSSLDISSEDTLLFTPSEGFPEVTSSPAPPASPLVESTEGKEGEEGAEAKEGEEGGKKEKEKEKEKEKDEGQEYLFALNLPKDTIITPEAWKQLYYKKKFKEASQVDGFLSDLCHEYLLGLVWVLRYYYDGVASWNWFYPYHYAPLVSDLIQTTSFDFKFDLNAPFTPLAQLLGVLSPLSYKLLPKPYAELMTSPVSPLADLYPLEFEIDREGTRNPWEGVVLLPFLDEKRLFECIKAIPEEKLTDAERSRNQFCDAKAFRYSFKVTCKSHGSSLSSYAPIVNSCAGMTTRKIKETAPGEKERDHFFLLPDAGKSRNAPALFPSLDWLSPRCHLENAKVNIFGFPSRRDSLCLSVGAEQLTEEINVKELGEKYLGKSIFVEFPYLKEALVVGVSNSSFQQLAGDASPTPLTDEQLMVYQNQVKRQKKDALRKAIFLKSVSGLVLVRLFQGVQELADGTLTKRWSEELVPFAWDMIVPNVPSWYDLYDLSKMKSLSVRFPVMTRVVYIAPGPHFGRECLVVSHRPPEKLVISFLYQHIPEPTFGGELLRGGAGGAKGERWFDVHNVLGQVQMSYRAFSRLAASVMVAGRDLGLNVRSGKRNIFTDGYARKNGRTWEVSQKLLEEVKAYRKVLPSLFRFLESNNPIELRNVFPDFDKLEDAEAALDKHVEWLGELGSAKSPKFPGGSVIAGAGAVAKLQKEIGAYFRSYVEQFKKQGNNKEPKLEVHHTEIRAPANKHFLADFPSVDFMLGDRVICVSENSDVPFGMRGTVVGLRGGGGWGMGGPGGNGGAEVEYVSADVLFDKKFVRGSDLGGRCSALRGGEAVPLKNLLNLTGGAMGRKETGGSSSGPGTGINLFNVNPQQGVWGGTGGNAGRGGGQRPPQFVPPQGGRGSPQGGRGGSPQGGRGGSPQGGRGGRGGGRGGRGRGGD